MEANMLQDKISLDIESGKPIHPGPVSFQDEFWWEELALGK